MRRLPPVHPDRSNLGIAQVKDRLSASRQQLPLPTQHRLDATFKLARPSLSWEICSAPSDTINREFL